MRLINLTPHAIHVHDAGGALVETLPSAGEARVIERTECAGAVSVRGLRVAIRRVGYAGIAGLPAPAPDTLLVVSRLVCEHEPGRTDLVFPLDVLRDATGNVRGCRAFGSVAAG